MSRNISCYEVGNTVKFTWVSSGAAPTTIISTILNGNESIVSSKAAVSSGDGHYYANMAAPNTPGYYVNKWDATIGVNSYHSRRKFQVIRTEVD